MEKDSNHEILQQRIQELEAEVQSLAMAQEVAQVGSWDWHLLDNTLAWSDETFRQFGLEPQELKPSYEIFCQFVHPDELDAFNHRVRQALDENRPFFIAVRMLRKDGSQWFLQAQGTVYRDASGQPVRFVGTQRDITDIRQVEEELRLQSEVIDKLSEGVCLVREEDGVIFYTNPQFDAMFGYVTGEIIGQHVSVVNAPTDKSPEEKAKEIMAAISGAGRRWQGEVNNVRKDGTFFWSLASISRLQHWQHGSVLISVLTDITVRKQAEEELRLQGEIMANMAEGVYLIRAADEIIVFANEMFEKMFGYAAGEMIGHHVSIVNVPVEKNQEETAKEIMADLQTKGSWQGEVCNIKKDGTFFWCQASVSTFDHPLHGEVMVSIHTDITERKRAEAALFESEKRSRLILSRSMDGFFFNDQKGRILDANEAFCNLVGYSREQLQEMTVPDLEAIETVEDVDRHMQSLIRTGNERFETQHWHRDGHLVDVELSVTYDRSLGDLFFSFVRDISARKRTEISLRENEEKYRLIFESSMDAIYQLDLKGNTTFMNGAGAKMFGYSPEEIVGQHLSFLVSESNVGKATMALHEAISGKNAQGEILIRHRNGNEFTVNYSLAPLKKEDQIVGVTGISRDITDRLKEEEKQLRESLAEKESLLKEIHHRVKNNMQIISSLLSLQSMQSSNSEVQVAIRDSQNRVKTMGLIHEKLYQTENLAKIEFSDYVGSLTEYLATTYAPSSRKVQIIIAAKDIFLSADTAIPCGLIITELVTNSFKYAFLERQQGRIDITMTRNDENRIILSISDNGCGLPDGFNIDEADSLGMSLVQNLARQLDATMTFQNDSGAVCRFEFAA